MIPVTCLCHRFFSPFLSLFSPRFFHCVFLLFLHWVGDLCYLLMPSAISFFLDISVGSIILSSRSQRCGLQSLLFPLSFHLNTSTRLSEFRFLSTFPYSSAPFFCITPWLMFTRGLWQYSACHSVYCTYVPTSCLTLIFSRIHNVLGQKTHFAFVLGTDPLTKGWARNALGLF